MIPQTAYNRFLFLTLALVLFCHAGQSGMAQSSVPVLQPGEAIERELTKGQTHSYRTTLEAGQYLFAIVKQREIALTVKIYGAGGQQLAEASGNSSGELRIFFVSEMAGEYRVEVRAANENVDTQGHYDLKIAELRPATDEDRSRYAAQELVLLQTQPQARVE